jgi:hypothetical protein
MSIAEIKQQLHDYIDTAEDEKLKAFYTWLEDDISEDYQFSEDQKKELEKRYHNYQNNIGKTYTWEETLAITDKTLGDRRKHNAENIQDLTDSKI